jgi:putative oxidoreductase
MTTNMTSRTGTTIAQVLLRTWVGSTMIAHGVRHGRSLDGTTRWFDKIGFRQPRMQAVLSSVIEIGAGSALIVGAATPFAAAAVIGTMSVAGQTVHRPNGFFVVDEGGEYVATLAVASTALAALGPGPMSLDRALGVDSKISGGRGAALALLLGIGGAAGQLRTFWTRPDPVA